MVEPQGLKPALIFAWAARLKPCPSRACSLACSATTFSFLPDAGLQLIVRPVSRSREHQVGSRSGYGIAVLVDLHTQAQTHRGKYLLDFVQRLAAEVLGLDHFRFGLLHQFANRLNVRVLQAVVAAHRKLEL